MACRTRKAIIAFSLSTDQDRSRAMPKSTARRRGHLIVGVPTSRKRTQSAIRLRDSSFARRNGLQTTQHASASKDMPILRKKPLGENQAHENSYNAQDQLPFDVSLLSPDDAKDKVFVAIVKALLVLDNVPLNPYELAAFIIDNEIEHIGGLTPKQTVSSRISQHFKRVSESPDPKRVATLVKTQTTGNARKLRYCLNPRAGLPGVPAPKLRPDERFQAETIPLYTPAKGKQSIGQANLQSAKERRARSGATSFASRGCPRHNSSGISRAGTSKQVNAHCLPTVDRRDARSSTPQSTEPISLNPGRRKRAREGFPLEIPNPVMRAGRVKPVSRPFPDFEMLEPSDARCTNVTGSPRTGMLNWTESKCIRLKTGGEVYHGSALDVGDQFSTFGQDKAEDIETSEQGVLDLECMQSSNDERVCREELASFCASPGAYHRQKDNKRARVTGANSNGIPIVDPISPIPSQPFMDGPRNPAFHLAGVESSQTTEEKFESAEGFRASALISPIKRQLQKDGSRMCLPGGNEQHPLAVVLASPTPSALQAPAFDANTTGVISDFKLSTLYSVAEPTDEDEDLCRYIQQYSPLTLSHEDFAGCNRPYSGPENPWESRPFLDMDTSIISWSCLEGNLSGTCLRERAVSTEIMAMAANPLSEIGTHGISEFSDGISPQISLLNKSNVVQEKALEHRCAHSQTVQICGVSETVGKENEFDQAVGQRSPQTPAVDPPLPSCALRYDISVCNSETKRAGGMKNKSSREARQRWQHSSAATPSLLPPCSSYTHFSFNYQVTEASKTASNSTQASSQALVVAPGSALPPFREADALRNLEVTKTDAISDEYSLFTPEQADLQPAAAEPLPSRASSCYSDHSCKSGATEVTARSNERIRRGADEWLRQMSATGLTSIHLPWQEDTASCLELAEVSRKATSSGRRLPDHLQNSLVATSKFSVPLYRHASRSGQALSSLLSSGLESSDDEGKAGKTMLRDLLRGRKLKRKNGERESSQEHFDSCEGHIDPGLPTYGSHADRSHKRQKTAALCERDIGGRYECIACDKTTHEPSSRDVPAVVRHIVSHVMLLR